MVHTLPDYTTKYKMVKVFSGVDVYEAAARLGSIDRFDRRGHVVWMDNFEAPNLRWNTSLQGSGGSISLDTSNPYTGTQSVKISTCKGTSVYSSIFKRLQTLPFKRIGFEISFTINSNIDAFVSYANIYDSTKYYYPFVEYKLSENALKIWKKPHTFKTIDSNLQLKALDDLYHTMKYVIDLEEGKYVRILLDDNEYDVSDVELDTYSSTEREHIVLFISYLTSSDTSYDVWVDNVIITQNEP